MITDVMTPQAITTGLVLITLGALCLVIWALRDERNPGPMFITELTVPGPGMCGCGAPKCTPPAAPFPGEMLAAPVAGPVALPAYVAEAIGHDGDTQAWVDSEYSRIQAGELRERLRAEEAEEALS